uniref:Uncharacterized protein n=1 Tax=Borrelia puertoricensis TaxID=2756107 RepID=A0AA51UNG4_9SPIR|nr:hypothetical protein MHINFGKF_00002 [Borrelia puertoricensis]
MSFESFFSLMFEDTIRYTFVSIKKSQREKEEGLRKLMVVLALIQLIGK